MRLRAAYQYEDFKNYRHSSPVTYTRGYSYRVFSHFTNLSFNYRMPIAHVDWHIGPIVNFQRIYTNLFFDQGYGQRDDIGRRDLRAFGTELFVNFNAFRLLALLNLGLRYSYIPDNNEWVPELVIAPVTF